MKHLTVDVKFHSHRLFKVDSNIECMGLPFTIYF